METKINDVIHLYLNSELTFVKGTLTSIHKPISKTEFAHAYSLIDEDFKPILKDLSDITEEDWTALGFEDESEWYHFLWEYPTPQFNEKGFMYLLSKGYDLFNLLSTNQAINAKKD